MHSKNTHVLAASAATNKEICEFYMHHIDKYHKYRYLPIVMRWNELEYVRHFRPFGPAINVRKSSKFGFDVRQSLGMIPIPMLELIFLV